MIWPTATALEKSPLESSMEKVIHFIIVLKLSFI